MIRARLSSFLVLANVLVFASAAQAQIFSAAGNTPATIQATVDAFRTALGPNNGVGGSFPTGRREINWDGVPDALSSPNPLPHNFFNVNSPRGATFSTPNKGSNLDDSFFVSAKQSSGVPVRFGDLDPSYTATFQAFSPERLFTQRDSNVITIQFFVPGTKIPALVKGFGVVLTDVDVAASASITLYGLDGDVLGSTHGFQTAPGGLSFWGVVFPDEPIASVVLVLGNTPLASGAVDGTAGVDVVAMDDFIYGEPHAREAHTADFDGDSLADLSVFRPSSGQWFVLNSGSNTFGISTFGLPGDIAVNADFDGDRRNDLVVFRPTSGLWFIQGSAGSASVVQWGVAGDIPVPGDYDKDGRVDIAVWRPADGNFYVRKSSDGLALITHWGSAGDSPVGRSGGE